MQQHLRTVIMLLLGVLAAYLVADTVAGALITALSLAGPAALVFSMVTFAALFFFVLMVFERFSGIRILGPGR